MYRDQGADRRHAQRRRRAQAAGRRGVGADLQRDLPAGRVDPAPPGLDPRPRHGRLEQVEHAVVFDPADVLELALLLGVEALQGAPRCPSLTSA